MRARLKIDVESRAARSFSGLLQSENFRVLQTVDRCASLRRTMAFAINNDRAHARIRRSQPHALPRQLERAAEKRSSARGC